MPVEYEMRTVPQGVFKVVSFEMEIRNAMTKRIWQDYCSNKCFIPVSRNTGRIPRCSSILRNICWLFSLRKTVNIDQRYTGQNVRQIACVCGQRISKRSICLYLWKIVTQNNTVHESSKDCLVQYIRPDTNFYNQTVRTVINYTWGKKRRKFKFLNTESLFVNKLI